MRCGILHCRRFYNPEKRFVLKKPKNEVEYNKGTNGEKR